jgi:rod shape-determining protein MreC
LITDPNSGVDVLVQRTPGARHRFRLAGTETIMKYVKRSEDIQVGDRLITTGLDGVFPKGLMVGTVTKVQKQNLGLFQYIELTPSVFSQTERFGRQGRNQPDEELGLTGRQDPIAS